MKESGTKKLVLCALFAAMTAVLSQVVVPIGPVPINLATFSVLFAGAMLGAKYGALSQALYVLLGAAGVPVFTMLSGGMSVVVGPRGGYIIGYIAAAGLAGFIVDRFGYRFYIPVLAMVAGAAAYFVMGTCWYVYVTNTPPIQAFMICVAPFLLGDALKITLAATLTVRLRPVLYR